MQKIVTFNRAFLYCCMVALFCLHPFISKGERLQGKPLTISIKNTSLAEVLRQVSKKSGVYIYFQDADLSSYPSVSIDVKNKPVDVVLHELLDGRGLNWVEVDKNSVAVRKKEVVSNNGNSNYNDTTVTVSGRVVDEKGAPIPGATILVKGEHRGVTSGTDGSFVILGVSSKSVLTISSVQFLTKDVVLKGKNIIGNIQLEQFVGELDETVVIAYGTTSRRFSTGNIASVKASDIAIQPINNPLLALQGRVPGLMVEQSTGLSGSGVTVRIQGQNSMANGNDPFFVVDGVPFTSQLLPSSGAILGNSGVSSVNGAAVYGNPLSFINPNDIESIEVLKDADATSIYGSRAANGAILITTKHGRTGRTQIDLTVNSGIGQATPRLKLLSSVNYLKLRREAISNDNLAVNSRDYDINGFWDTTRTTDWQKKLIGGTAQYNDIQLSTSGGTESTTFRVAGGYHKETTVFPGEFSDLKYSGHFNFNHTSENRKFNIQLTGSYLSDINKLPKIDLTGVAVQLAPDAPQLYDKFGGLNWELTNTGRSTWINPLAYINKLYENRTQNFVTNSLISYEIIKGLILKTNLGFNSLNTNEITEDKLTSIRPENRSIVPRSGAYTYNKANSWIVEPQITFNRKIGDGKFDALIGLTFQTNESDGSILVGSGYNSDQLISDIKSAETIVASSTTRSSYKYDAAFMRLNYILNDKYIINLSGRRDGSSRFGANNKFNNFASVGGAWIFSSETYIKEALPWMDLGKVKGSYGTTGSDQIGDYKYLNLYETDGGVIPYQGISTLSPIGLSNKYIQWEQVKKIQFGLDLSLLKERISFSVTYFRNRSNNQLLNLALPSISGFRSVAGNFPALVQNSGWELSLTTQNLRNQKVNWTSGLNVTIPKNKLIEFQNLSSSLFSGDYTIGQPITIHKAYNFQGVNPVDGTYQFKNSKGEITSDPNSETDRTIIQNTMPALFGGFQNTITIDRFKIDFLFQFVKQLGNNMNFGFYIPGQFNKNQPQHIEDRWKEKGDQKNVERVSSNSSLSNSYFNVVASDAAFTDASFIRLKTVSISWQLPGSSLSGKFLKSGSIFLRAQNLLTITSYNGLDPETKSSTTLPPLRVITAGIQISM